MNTNEKNEKFIEMTELSNILKATGSRTAIKWCEDHNLPIIPVGSKKVTYRFLAEAILDKQLVQVLKKQHPTNWKHLYDLYRNNDLQGYLLATQEKHKTTIRLKPRTTSKSKPRTKFAQQLANE